MGSLAQDHCLEGAGATLNVKCLIPILNNLRLMDLMDDLTHLYP